MSFRFDGKPDFTMLIKSWYCVSRFAARRTLSKVMLVSSFIALMLATWHVYDALSQRSSSFRFGDPKRRKQSNEAMDDCLVSASGPRFHLPAQCTIENRQARVDSLMLCRRGF